MRGGSGELMEEGGRAVGELQSDILDHMKSKSDGPAFKLEAAIKSKLQSRQDLGLAGLSASDDERSRSSHKVTRQRL